MFGGFIKAGPGRTTEVSKCYKKYYKKGYKKYYKKAKPRCLEVGDKVLILFPADSNKLLMQWRRPYIVGSHVGAND